MLIDLKEKCGKKTISRPDGKKVREIIVKSWAREKTIEIEFGNIQIASVSFFDEAFGRLTSNFPKEILRKKLKFSNIDKYDRALLNDILISRYHQLEVDGKV